MLLRNTFCGFRPCVGAFFSEVCYYRFLGFTLGVESFLTCSAGFEVYSFEGCWLGWWDSVLRGDVVLQGLICAESL